MPNSHSHFLLPIDFSHPSVERQAYSGKVHNLLWSQLHSPQHLFSCGPDGQITWWNISHNEGQPAQPTFDVTPLCSFILPPSKQRWASAIEVFLDPSVKETSGRESWTKDSVVVVCGDRKGSLHLFDPKNATGSSQEASCFLCFKDSLNFYIMYLFSKLSQKRQTGVVFNDVEKHLKTFYFRNRW